MISRARQIGVLLLAFTMGCASAPPRWDFSPGWLPGIRTSKQKEPSRKIKDLPLEEDEDSGYEPLIAQDEPKSGGASGGPIVHDPATRMLIEAELREASAEDRAEWIALLESVDSDQVPYLLQLRRFSNGGETEASHSPLASTPGVASAKAASNEAIAPNAGMKSGVVTASGTAPTDHLPLFEKAAATEGTEPVLPQKSASNDLLSPSAWPQKIRSFADPTRIWTHPADGGESVPGSEKGPLDKLPAERPAAEKAAADKPERISTFGLPLILGNQAKADAALAQFHARESAPEQPRQIAAALPVQAPPRLTPGSALWEDEVQKLISLLEAETSVSGNSASGSAAQRDDIRKQVALRMLYLVENQPQKAQQVIPGLPDYEQEFWTDLFLGLAEHLDQSGATDAGERATQTVAHLRSAAFRLQQTAKLRLRNLVICQKINGFGDYEPFPSSHFSAGQAVLIYSEIRNFISAPTTEGIYRTRIRSTIEIYTGGNEQHLVDRNSFEATEDQCRTLRTDYFHSYRLSLPSHLTSGPHILKLMIQDEISGKIATESIQFVVQ
ncbi:MAG TPA: hypothetical protein VNQ76_09680 [Planctomicrobium sp.]|nr:hypothetical protein [Planctomicrobium sp.]